MELEELRLKIEEKKSDNNSIELKIYTYIICYYCIN